MTDAAAVGAASAGTTGLRPPLPTDILPHRPPFLFVDEVLSVEPGRRATGIWRLTGQEPFFAGHFPGRPMLPGVLMVEAMAQLGGVALLTDPRCHGYLALFGGIDKARFRRPVLPGDTLEMSVEIDQASASAGRGHGAASVGGKVAATVSMLFVLIKP
ncbi:MAG TPA: 3-hydroxyacyl-ACP dehydratase FabZ [Acidimicrobiales bacterium]|nr:3-hydroxyacyl-ACP dehydratase FabZ [Acidimicrobiales bacterium]